MKHWILSLVFMFIAILSGFELGKYAFAPEKNWLVILLLGAVCAAAVYFYFKERTKRMAEFRERMNNANKKK